MLDRKQFLSFLANDDKAEEVGVQPGRRGCRKPTEGGRIRENERYSRQKGPYLQKYSSEVEEL